MFEAVIKEVTFEEATAEAILWAVVEAMPAPDLISDDPVATELVPAMAMDDRPLCPIEAQPNLNNLEIENSNKRVPEIAFEF